MPPKYKAPPKGAKPKRVTQFSIGSDVGQPILVRMQVGEMWFDAVMGPAYALSVAGELIKAAHKSDPRVKPQDDEYKLVDLTRTWPEDDTPPGSEQN